MRRLSLGDVLMASGIGLAVGGTYEAAGLSAALAVVGAVLVAVGWKLG